MYTRLFIGSIFPVALKPLLLHATFSFVPFTLVTAALYTLFTLSCIPIPPHHHLINPHLLQSFPPRPLLVPSALTPNTSHGNPHSLASPRSDLKQVAITNPPFLFPPRLHPTAPPSSALTHNTASGFPFRFHSSTVSFVTGTSKHCHPSLPLTIGKGPY